MVHNIRFLNQQDVIKAGGFDMELAMKAVEHTFVCQAKGDYVLPMKTVLRWGGPETESDTGRINCMPAYVGGDYQMVGIKWIGSQPNNVKRNLPRASAVIVLNDKKTKFPIAIMEGAIISSMRTAAVTGVATKYLSLENSKVLGAIGAGALSHTHILAVLTARPGIEEIRLYDLDFEKSKAFIEKYSPEFGVQMEAVKTAEDACAGADVIFTATTTSTPIVKNEWVKPGAFYSQVAGYEAEIDLVTKSDKVVGDDWEQILHRGLSSICVAINKGVYTRDQLYSELKDIVIGSRPGRENGQERIFFNSVGMGTEDVALGTEILRRAKENNIGKDMPFFWVD